MVMKPTLIVSVDTEEEGLWSGAFARDGGSVENLKALPRFQALCEKHGVAPTYLVDTPAALHEPTAELLGGLQREGKAEVGAHLHPWCAPPFEEESSTRNSFLCNLPPLLQWEKLRGLTELIESKFGARPKSFRAGRYGLGPWGAQCLRRLGYKVDSSVIPYFDYSRQGGPDFGLATVRPYYVDPHDLLVEADPRRPIRSPGKRGPALAPLLEVPVSTGFSHGRFDAASRWRRWAERSTPRRLRVVGVLDRLGLARRIKFSPEQHSAAELKRLAELYVDQRMPCLMMLLHSSSLSVGCSPYAADEHRLERLYETLDSVLAFCRNDLGLETQTLTSFADSFSASSTQSDHSTLDWAV